MAKATKEKSSEKGLKKKKKKKISSASRQSDGPETKTTSKASGESKAKSGESKAKSGESKAKSAEPKKSKSKSKAKTKAKEDDAKGSKRKLGLRGAAPWAARHAAKHAAEARARAAEPAPPGSARATIRVPQGAEEIKAKIGELHNQTMKIRTLRKRMEKGFFEIGQVLAEIQEQELFQAKGYGSFEAFLERETDLGKQTSLKLVKLSKVFQREAALDYGMDRCFAGLAALEGEVAPKAAAPSSPGPALPLPLKPPMRMVSG
ncbi:MAG TPA: hypothetical protein PK156_15005 [Polyangium sp.]|nr:hypothetical protein [Polyangium sp.]